MKERNSKIEDEDWTTLRKALELSLEGLNDENLFRMSPDTAPQSIREIRFFMRGQSFESRLDETIEITRAALDEAVSEMSEFHSLAAAVKLNAPSDDQIRKLKADMAAVQSHLEGDARFRSGISLLQAVASLVPDPPAPDGQ